MIGKVLVVDDEEAIRFFTSYGLTKADWQVYEVDSGEAALTWLEANTCDVILLDLQMAGIDGLSVMRQVKNKSPEIMIIIMTAFASIDSAIEAVRQGAFDYLQKPCVLDDIIDCANRAIAEKAKLDQQRELVRQAETLSSDDPRVISSAPLIIKTGSLVIELGSHAVSLMDQTLSLTPTEYELLELLAKTPGQPIPIEQLVIEGLGYQSGDPQAQETLRVHISRLRRKLGSGYILTIRGGGYALADIPPPE